MKTPRSIWYHTINMGVMAKVGCRLSSVHRKGKVPSMTVDLDAAVVGITVCFGGAYLFWLTYRDPGKNRATRFLDWYVEATHFRLLGPRNTMVAIIAIMLATGFATVALIIASIIDEL